MHYRKKLRAIGKKLAQIDRLKELKLFAVGLFWCWADSMGFKIEVLKLLFCWDCVCDLFDFCMVSVMLCVSFVSAVLLRVCVFPRLHCLRLVQLCFDIV